MRDYKKLKHVLIASFVLTFYGCKEVAVQVDQCALNPTQEEQENGQVRKCVLPEKDEFANLEINANLRDFIADREGKMLDALERLKIVVNSKEFKQQILNHEYQGQKMFVDNQGYSNLEIYNLIMLGAETLSPSEDEEIDIDITLYYSNNSTVGYTYPDTNRIWVNDKFFAVNSLGKVAANVLHEWTHKIGFDHDFKRTTRRNFSIPYGVGTIIEKMVDGM